MNHRLLDDLFENRFGGVTKLLQSIERTQEHVLVAEAGAGLGSVLVKLFLDVKARITAEGKIGKQIMTVVEKELSLQKKILLCEASLDSQGLIVKVPESMAITQGKYVELDNLLKTFTSGEEEGLEAEIGFEAAEVVLAR